MQVTPLLRGGYRTLHAHLKITESLNCYTGYLAPPCERLGNQDRPGQQYEDARYAAKGKGRSGLEGYAACHQFHPLRLIRARMRFFRRRAWRFLGQGEGA